MEAGLQMITGGEAGMIHIVNILAHLPDFLTSVKRFLDAAATGFDDAFLAAYIKANITPEEYLLAISQHCEAITISPFLVQIKLQGIRIYAGILIAHSCVAKEEYFFIFMIVVYAIGRIEQRVFLRGSSTQTICRKGGIRSIYDRLRPEYQSGQAQENQAKCDSFPHRIHSNSAVILIVACLSSKTAGWCFGSIFGGVKGQNTADADLADRT